MLTYNTILVLLGAGLLGALCGVVGCFAVLRRRALLGDTLAHAALPGIAVAFWLTQSKQLPILLLGALATGLFGIWTMAILKRHTRTKEDAALGLVLSVFFGAGIALSRYVQNEVKDGSTAGLDTYLLGKTAGIVRSDVILVAILCAFALMIVALLYKEFRLVSFDHDFAQSLGWNTTFLDFLQMALVAAAVVVGLPMVGVVLVAALTILPAVAARFWTETLSKMLVLSALFGVSSAVVGVWISAYQPKMPTGPLMILVAGAAFALSACIAPNRGVLAQSYRNFRFRLRHGASIAQRELAALGAMSPAQATVHLNSAGVAFPALTLAYARKHGLIQKREGKLVAAGATE